MSAATRVLQSSDRANNTDKQQLTKRVDCLDVANATRNQIYLRPPMNCIKHIVSHWIQHWLIIMIYVDISLFTNNRKKQMKETINKSW